MGVFRNALEENREVDTLVVESERESVSNARNLRVAEGNLVFLVHHPVIVQVHVLEVAESRRSETVFRMRQVFVQLFLRVEKAVAVAVVDFVAPVRVDRETGLAVTVDVV